MKRIFAFILSLLLAVSLTACGDKHSAPEPTPPASSVEDPATAPNTTPDTTDPMALLGDTYWVAYESEGDMREYVPEGDDLLTDLTLWADGTARIREIEDGFWLASGEEEQNMTWTCESDGTINFYCAYSGDMPRWIGQKTKDGIELQRYDGTYRFREQPMPTDGALYSPAELQGVWLQTGSEVEGDINATMPERFESLIFRTDWSGDAKTLVASAENGDWDGFAYGDGYYDSQITLLEEPIYSGCGNEVWSVRIGEESPLNEHGYPENVETYVTLLDQNTLLQQHYFSFDNGTIPGVSYQTYKRFLPSVPYGLEESDLAGRDFELVGYIDADGIRHQEHPTYTDFRLHLNAAGGYTFTACVSDSAAEDYTGGGHHWSLGEGSTILLCSENTMQDGHAGAVSCYDGMEDVPEIFLWDNMDGILCLKYTEDSGDEWSGYVDTMTDLEGNAFAAPANALLAYYGDGYLDMDWYRANTEIPVYELADGPDARQILISCVNDDSTLWIENDGFEIARLGTMMAGESVIIQVGYPESEGSFLYLEVGGEEYYIELSHSCLSLDMWDYIVT